MDTYLQETRKQSWEALLFQLSMEVSLPPSIYKKIDDRYNTLERILNAAGDPILRKVHIFPQGSIRTKTAIRPLNTPGDLGTVDADAVVWLENATNASAQDVLEAIKKRFVAGTLVDKPIEDLRRGIRVTYSDTNPGFHIDVTPARNKSGNSNECGYGPLEVPDRESGWKASSPIDYSDWLEKISQKSLRVLAMDSFREAEEVMAKATKENMPEYEDYVDFNVLRAVIKLIKRNRDIWANSNALNRKYRPISAVLTTLAALAYQKLAEASTPIMARSPYDVMWAIVDTMPEFIKGTTGNWQVRNPIDSGENFAEKWNRADGEKYREAFFQWHAGVRVAFGIGLEEFSSGFSFKDAIKESFGVGPTSIDNTLKQLPQGWNLPGRPLGTTGNSLALAILSGNAVASGKQQNVKQPDRLG